MFKGKIKQIVKEIEQKRQKGIEVNLRTHLETEYETTPEKLYAELGIDPNRVTVEQLMTMDEDTRWLFPEIVRDAISKGLGIIPFTDDIVASKETIGNNAQTLPYIDFSQMKSMKGKKVTPGSTIEEDTILFGDKTVKINKIAKGIKVPYESVKYATLNLLATYFKGVGARIQRDLNDLAVDTLINGDNGIDANGNSVDESAAVIGVKDTASGITYYDYLRAVIRMSKIGRPITSMIGGEEQIINIMNLDEFKKRETGVANTQLNLKTPVPTKLDTFISDEVGSKKVVLLSKPFSIVQLTSTPLLVESDKIIMRQLHVAAASITTGFAVVYRNGRVVIDGSKTYSSASFPSWMNY